MFLRSDEMFSRTGFGPPAVVWRPPRFAHKTAIPEAENQLTPVAYSEQLVISFRLGHNLTNIAASSEAHWAESFRGP